MKKTFSVKGQDSITQTGWGLHFKNKLHVKNYLTLVHKHLAAHNVVERCSRLREGSKSAKLEADKIEKEVTNAAACMSEMKYPVGENGSDMIKSMLTIDEFKQGFKLVAEKTSSFLSGQHLGHYYKYSLKDDILCLVYSILMSTPFEFGFHLSPVALYFTGNVGKNQGTTMSR